MKQTKVLYAAPGAGLGHLNRALAIGLELREMGVETRIATNSPFAEGVARLARFPVVEIRDWKDGVRAYAEEAQPEVVVCDTFPRGLRGEWAGGLPARGVYVARRLKAAALGDVFGGRGWAEGFEQVIAAEELGAEHEAVIRDSGLPVVRLPGRVRLRPGLVAAPAPAELERLLETGRCRLVVHGGPVEELKRLAELVKGAGPVAAITPWGQCLEGIPCFEYYPAGNLVGRAARVVSGAGYNIMSDMMNFRQRHETMPFERRYDDQAGRAGRWGEVEGTAAAAEAIANLVK